MYYIHPKKTFGIFHKYYKIIQKNGRKKHHFFRDIALKILLNELPG